MLPKDGFRFTKTHLLHTERLLVKRKPSWRLRSERRQPNQTKNPLPQDKT